jgi:uncharacterized protein
MSNKIERRILAGKLSIRSSASGDGPGMLAGYAAVFGQRSQDLGGFVEQLNVGCFDKVLASNPDVRCLFNHDPNLVLGRTSAGTLQLDADHTGLYMTCQLPDTSTGRDVHALVTRGDISQCSFGFSLDPGDASFDEETDSATGKKQMVRTIRNVSRLYDVSSVTSPAYLGTSVQARNLGVHYFIPTPPAPVAFVEPPSRFELHQRMQKIGQHIADEAYNEGLRAFINNRPRPNDHVKE